MSFSGLLVQLLNGLAGASSLFLVAAGLSLIFGVTRIVNFAHGSFFMVGIYVAYSLVANLGGTIGFYLKLNHAYSMMDAIEHANRLTPAVWSSLVAHCSGIDILPAPEAPVSAEVASERLHNVLQYARLLYDWIVVDLPAIFYRPSLLMLTESDSMYLVSTGELPSLHLARKAINMLTQLGLTKDRYKLLVNRVNKRDGIGLADFEKIFSSPVEAMFPNDYFSLHRVVTLGQPLGGDCELGKAVEGLARKLSGTAEAEKKKMTTMLEAARPALSHT